MFNLPNDVISDIIDKCSSASIDSTYLTLNLIGKITTKTRPLSLLLNNTLSCLHLLKSVNISISITSFSSDSISIFHSIAKKVEDPITLLKYRKLS